MKTQHIIMCLAVALIIGSILLVKLIPEPEGDLMAKYVIDQTLPRCGIEDCKKGLRKRPPVWLIKKKSAEKKYPR